MTTVNKKISDSTELLEFEHNTIIDCKVKLQNIFTKELPESQMGVYGDYDILIFYRHDSRRKSNYQVKTIRKTFNEILSLADGLEDYSVLHGERGEIKEVSFEPTCDFKLKNKHHNDVSYEIQVLGDIKITYYSKNHETQDETQEQKQDITEEQKQDAPEEQKQDVPEEQNQDAKQEQKDENVEKNILVPKFEDEVLQFQLDDDHPIEELMNMDLESLKKISKNQ